MATGLVLDGSQKTGPSGIRLSTTVQNSENLHERGENKKGMKELTGRERVRFNMFSMTAGERVHGTTPYWSAFGVPESRSWAM
jgi:hypothetical protein